jgi:hypothetical protein
MEALPQEIEALEEEKRRLMETINSPVFYVGRDAVEINKAYNRLEVLEEVLDEAYLRWNELENQAAKFSCEKG